MEWENGGGGGTDGEGHNDRTSQMKTQKKNVNIR